ncbi:beta-xylanase [Vibrio inusitatus NBRC 102082]|uniref:Beta-xylanase n=1 Tax=Vibrio inusitatus NBRC 102082 TaxID=1219070 RepID=A0A4Y3HSH3_9VIBR|nr:endo-1,4-beta-xylanase [Vibrio inusitatus]GEA49891.1 beta-xylanase [Vibrio inusitatus NBRC 102082]
MSAIKKSALALVILSLVSGCNTRYVNSGNDDTGSDPSCSIELPSEEVASLKAVNEGLALGVALPAGQASNSIFKRPDLETVTVQHFNQITAENIMKPSYMQPEQDVYEFDDTDRFVAFAEQNGMSVHGHMLVWHKRIADFKQNCSGSIQCSQYMTDHIATVVGHYEDRIVSWDVVNEAFTDDYGSGSDYRNYDNPAHGVEGSVWYREIGKDYIPIAFLAANAADPNALLYYNDYQLERDNDKLRITLEMINELQVEDVPIHGIGFQMHITHDVPSSSQLRSALQQAVDTGLLVKITEMDVRMNEYGNVSCYNTTVAQAQQKRYQEVVTTYLEIVPEGQRGGISFWGVTDEDSWIPDFYEVPDWPLLFDESLNQKHALVGVANALK